MTDLHALALARRPRRPLARPSVPRRGPRGAWRYGRPGGVAGWPACRSRYWDD
ncbi:hypothetical protein [Chitiniphilus eburneus]|uniref:hypothetical protein n=1 Tax=Chitiniphilus eburneus TaxID=2571148 RepID=UPI0035D07824